MMTSAFVYDDPDLPEKMVGALKVGTALLATELGRLPTQAEVEMIWSAVQRHHGVPEHLIVPASSRRWN